MHVIIIQSNIIVIHTINTKIIQMKTEIALYPSM